MDEIDAFQSSRQIKTTICLAAHGKQNAAAPSKAGADEQQRGGWEEKPSSRPAGILILSPHVPSNPNPAVTDYKKQRVPPLPPTPPNIDRAAHLALHLLTILAAASFRETASCKKLISPLN